ncbi:TonB-linked outer membrane protein, SusC/RagA family [Filimonas lacunae]|uniref:TonB-linked outer membrane protein, SusC/RagA family n=1 Tax=Filimonas lacunae TaxID=477680 RepID=A0A1N7RH22_9BACT|nr:SusC/RagA family TonB-linked outer membrane protein [Filimonas lacunae]SIT34395.1 TonB-linked outer membrane protein, SusC/RagA family [Filimonas lacunae]
MNIKNIRACCLLFAASMLHSAAIKAQTNKDSLVNVAFKTVAREDLPGAVTSINVTELLKKNYATYSLDNLQSLVGGYTGNIWGQAPLILVDGIPRRATDVRPVEIETITILKGASSVVLYGSNASKGVVLITTKRGTVKPLSIDVRANSGWFFPKAYPSYLKAADYMTLYNEASRNDGVAERYTQDQINATAAGTNPYRYPDVDFFNSAYLKKAYTRQDVTTEISGGNEFARYYTNFGASYNNSIMNFGEQKKNNDFNFNIRANVDMNLTSWLTASTDAVAIFNNNYTGRGNFWGASATMRPNWFSPFIPISMFSAGNAGLKTIADNSNHLIDGQYLLGGISTDQTNAFADNLAAGYIKTRNRTLMYNVGATADLGSAVKGLKFKTVYSMDYTSLYSEAYQVSYATYEPTWATVDGKDVITSLRKYNNDLSSTNEYVGQTAYTQTMSLRSQFNYDRTFASNHNITGTLLGWWYLTQFSSDADNNGGSTYHPIRNTNLGFQAGYNFKKRYYVDFSAAVVHSAKMPPGKRNALSPTVTVGWRISDEAFFKNKVTFVDNLKLNASYANIKQDLDITGFRPDGTTPTDYYLYQGYYGNNGQLGGWYPWRDGASGGFTSISGQGTNPDFTFVRRNEFRVGLEASLLKGAITMDVNYFRQNTNGLLTRGVLTYPSWFSGNGDFRPWLNYNNDRRTGVDFAVNLNRKLGEVQYSIGVTGMVFNSTAVRRDEIYLDAYQNRAGKALDAYWGYISDGFFQDQADIDGHARQTFGGTLKPGDIKYRDVNNDGVVDGKDQVNLGRNGWAANPFNYGINLTVKWRHFTLFALASGQTGAIGFKNSSYYWVRGTSKFSDAVWGRWTEATKNTADYPRLTTTAGNNNYQNSTFWMYKTNRFNLSRVQLTYDFNNDLFKNSVIHGLSVYVLGDNLLVLSKERKLMETNIGTAPQYRFYNLGIRASF